MTFYDMTWLERLLFLKRIKGGGSGHEETTTSNSFVTDMVAPLRKLLLTLNPKQSGSGDPSPDNVRPISGWDSVSVLRAGKNLFDGEWESGSINSSGQPASGGSNIRPKHKIFVLPSKTYAISHSSGSRNIYWYTYKADGSFSRYIGLKNTASSTIVTNADEYYLWCYQYNNTSAPTNMQIEISPKTDYEPYAGQTYTTYFTLGKNLLDINASGIIAGKTILNDGTLSDASAVSMSDYIHVPSNEALTYTSAGDPVGNTGFNRRIICYDSNKQFLGSIATTSDNPKGVVTITGTTLDGTAFVRVPFGRYSTSGDQLEIGSTATSYEPYKSVYGGTLDMVSGVLTVTQKLVDLGSLAWSVRNEYFRTAVQSDAKKGANNVLPNAHCSALVVGTPNGFLNTNNSIAVATDGRFNVYSTAWTGWTGAQVREALDGVMFTYELATPQTYQLTPQQINTLIGTNNILTDAEVSEIIYLKKAE